MKNKAFQVLVVASALSLSACGGNADVKEKLGLKVAPPDEFSVVTRAPLAVPPDYTLRPPRPGADRPNELSIREETRKTVFGVNDTAPAKAPASESASSDFLNQLGTNQADPNIRADINTTVRALDKKEQPVADRLLFWKEKEAPGKTIDPVEEQRRLQGTATAPATTETAPETDEADTTTTKKSGGVTTTKKRNEDILKN